MSKCSLLLTIYCVFFNMFVVLKYDCKFQLHVSISLLGSEFFHTFKSSTSKGTSDFKGLSASCPDRG